MGTRASGSSRRWPSGSDEGARHRGNRLHRVPPGDGGQAARRGGGGARTDGLPEEQANAALLEEAGVEVVSGSITDAVLCARAVAGATHIFHLAVAMREGGKRDDFFERVNLDGTRRLLDAAASKGVERFVYCSTIGIYGHRAPGITREDSPLAPGNVYERTKVAAEALVREVGAARGLPIVILRPADVYGPRDQRLLKLFRGCQPRLVSALRLGRRQASHGVRGRRRVRLLSGLPARRRGGREHDRGGAGGRVPCAS